MVHLVIEQTAIVSHSLTEVDAGQCGLTHNTGSMVGSLSDFLPAAEADADELLGHFLDYVDGLGLTLYPAQEDAILELFAGKNVILNTPTGSGKSLVASAMHFDSLARGRRSVYTCPIKALVNEKFFALCEELGAHNIGMLTGDASINRGAPVLCCTAVHPRRSSKAVTSRARRRPTSLLPPTR